MRGPQEGEKLKKTIRKPAENKEEDKHFFVTYCETWHRALQGRN